MCGSSSRYALAAVVLAYATTSARAQVFIPDMQERAWLNGEIPGIVDGSGIMDTLHPGIADLDSSLFILYSLPEVVELHGVEYLDSLSYFRFFTYGQMAAPTNPAVITVDGWPSHLRQLEFGIQDEYPVDIYFPQLPAQMELIDAWPMAVSVTRLHIAGMPEELGQLKLGGLDSVSWQGSCHVQYLEIHGLGAMDYGPLHVPPIQVEEMHVNDVQSTTLIDLSQITATVVNVNASILNGTMLWPQGVEEMWLSGGCYFADLGILPATLEELYAMTTVIECMSELPESLHTFLLDYPPDCFQNWPDALLYTGGSELSAYTVEYCNALNSLCPNASPAMSGRMFVDLDLDGQYDSGEPALPDGGVLVQPGNAVVGCDEDGRWQLAVTPGSYTITALASYPYIASVSPSQQTAELPATGVADTLNDFAVTLIPGIADLRVHMESDPARPGFNNRVYLTCQNYGTVSLDAQLTFGIDAAQSWVGSSSTPSTLTASSATWDLPGLGVGLSETIMVDLYTEPTVSIGTPLIHTLTALPVSGDETPGNNVYNRPDTVVGSFDPNDKLLSPASLSQAQVEAGVTPITYTIRFQNTGSFMAERVLVLDTIPAGLQQASMHFLGSSHPCTWSLSAGVLHVVFDHINLPEEFMDEPGSHGFLRFSILPDPGLEEGSAVVNIAHIVFDYNMPIVTPPAVFTIDEPSGMAEQGTPAVRVHPNPATDRIWVRSPEGNSTALYVVVLDGLGRTVLSGRTDPAGSLDISKIPVGVYVLAMDQGGASRKSRFVKR